MPQDREYIKLLDIYHYNEKTHMYTALTISPVPDDNSSVFVSLRKGMKGEKPENISVKLSKQELAYLALESSKIFNNLE